MAIGVDQIYLSMTSPETGAYLTANVYTVDGVYEPDGVTPRLLSIGQLVMALCLKRAASLETDILASDVNMSSRTLSYKGTTYTYYAFLTEVVDVDNVPSGTANKNSTEFISSLESKMDENNTFSQKTMIELQSQTNKRDQAYDMISNVLKSFSTVMTATVNNV